MRLKQTVITSVLALSAATGVAVAGVGGDAPADDPEQPTGAVTVRAEPVREGAGPARILVTRDPGAVARVRWSTSAGTATGGLDFDAGSGVLQFRPGEHAKVLEVGVTADGDPEGPETFDLRLDDVPGVDEPADPAVATVVIVD